MFFFLALFPIVSFKQGPDKPYNICSASGCVRSWPGQSFITKQRHAIVLALFGNKSFIVAGLIVSVLVGVQVVVKLSGMSH